MINENNNKNEIIIGEKKDGIDYVTRTGVYGVTFNKVGQVAIFKTQYGYFLPGGGLENEESKEECLMREFKEELGCDILIDKFIGKASKYYYSDVFNHYRHPIGFFFIVVIKNESIESIEEDKTLHWMYAQDCLRLLHEHQAWAVLEATKYIN